MPQYFYTARKKDGSVTTGTVEALSLQEAHTILCSSGLSPEELHEATLRERQSDPLTGAPPPMPLPEQEEPAPSLMDERMQEALTAAEQSKEERMKKEAPKRVKAYVPLIETLRLYAGWLLAWYCLAYALGAYQHTRELPFRIPYVEALLPPFSPLVLSFTLAAFLFLLFTTIHKTLGGVRWGIVLTVLGVVVFGLYRINVA